jgi:hypothetical protein
MSVCMYSCLSNPVCKSHLFCAALYCHQWPVSLYHIFSYYLINGKIFKKMIIEHNCFSLQLLSQIFLRGIQRDVIKIHTSCQILIKWNFLERFSRNTHTPNFMEIRSVGTQFSHAKAGQTDMTKLIGAFRNFAHALKKHCAKELKNKNILRHSAEIMDPSRSI